MGDLSTITSAIGLHQLSDDKDCPFFLREIRKRVMSSAYAMDKEFATMLGRPPRISSRYCSIQMPLDLSHDEIIASPDEIDLALQKLDENGWNTRGEATHEAKLRIATLTSLVRERILELSMCNTTSDLQARVEYVSFPTSEPPLHQERKRHTTSTYLTTDTLVATERSVWMLARCSKTFRDFSVGRPLLQDQSATTKLKRPGYIFTWILHIKSSCCIAFFGNGLGGNQRGFLRVAVKLFQRC